MAELTEAFTLLNYKLDDEKPIKKLTVDKINEKIHKKDQQQKQDLINSITKIIKNDFEKTNNLTTLYNKSPNYQIVKSLKNKLNKTTNNKFNIQKLPIQEIHSFSNDEINKINIILEYLIPRNCYPPDYSPYVSIYIGYKLYKFFNIKKYITDNEIMYNLDCILSKIYGTEVNYNIYCNISFKILKNLPLNQDNNIYFINVIQYGRVVVPITFYKIEQRIKPNFIENICVNDQEYNNPYYYISVPYVKNV